MTKPYVLIVVTGGVADLGAWKGDFDYDILDYDILKDQLAMDEEITLSQGEIDYLKKNDPEFWKRLEMKVTVDGGEEQMESKQYVQKCLCQCNDEGGCIACDNGNHDMNDVPA